MDLNAKGFSLFGSTLLLMLLAVPLANAQAANTNGPLDDMIRVFTFQDYNTRVVVIGTTLLGLAAGLIGTFLVLRKRALLSDTLSHATLPGIALAFIVMTLLTGDGKQLLALIVGAAIFAVFGTASVLVIQRFSRLKDDAALGIVLSVYFGLGIALDGHGHSHGRGQRRRSVVVYLWQDSIHVILGCSFNCGHGFCGCNCLHRIFQGVLPDMFRCRFWSNPGLARGTDRSSNDGPCCPGDGDRSPGRGIDIGCGFADHSGCVCPLLDPSFAHAARPLRAVWCAERFPWFGHVCTDGQPACWGRHRPGCVLFFPYQHGLRLDTRVAASGSGSIATSTQNHERKSAQGFARMVGDLE